MVASDSPAAAPTRRELPDGDRLVIAVPQADHGPDGAPQVLAAELVLLDLRDRSSTSLTDTPSVVEMQPAVAPGGERLAFADWAFGGAPARTPGERRGCAVRPRTGKVSRRAAERREPGSRRLRRGGAHPGDPCSRRAPAGAVYECGGEYDTCTCGRANYCLCDGTCGNCVWHAWHSACCHWGRAPRVVHRRQHLERQRGEPRLSHGTTPQNSSIFVCEASTTCSGRGHVDGW